MRLQVGGLVGDAAVADGVRLVEGVAGERLHQVEDGVRLRDAVAQPLRPLHEAAALGLHDLGVLLAHGLAHDVGLAQRVAGELARDLQHLVLVDDDAVGGVEDLGEVGVGVADRFVAVLGANEARDVVHGPGTVQRHHGRQVRQMGRFEVLHVAPHAPRLELEDAEGVARGEHRERRRVAVGQVDVVGALAGLVLHDGDRRLEDGEVGEPQEVHLEQADGGALVHRPLGHGDGALVVVLGAGGALQGDVLDQRLARDDDRGGVRAGVPRDAFELARLVDELLRLRLVVVGGAQLLAARQGGVQRGVGLRRDEAGDAVGGAVGHAQGAAGVADGGLRAQGAEGDDLRDAVVAVLVGDVADHLVAAVVGEVHVDVRHLVPLDVEEALEDEVVRERVDVGDLEAVKDDAGRGAAADAHGDALAARELREVAHDQEVLREARLLHDAEFVLQARDVLGRGGAVALPQPRGAQIGEVLLGGRAGGQVGVGELQAVERQLDVAALRDRDRVAQRLRQLREALGHLRLGRQIEVLAVQLEAVGLVHRGVGADAEQDFVADGVLGGGVMRVVGGDERQVELAGQVDELGDHGGELGVVVVLQLDVVAVAEDFAVPAGGGQGVGVAGLVQRPVQLRRGAAGEGDEALAVGAQALPVDAGAVVEALQVRLRGQRHEVAPAGVVHRQQRQVIGVGAGGGVALGHLAGRDVGLHAQDGVDAGAPAGAVEVERAVQVAVVGDGQGFLPQPLRALHERVDLGKAVEQAELGVCVEMREHRPGERSNARAAGVALVAGVGKSCGRRGEGLPTSVVDLTP